MTGIRELSERMTPDELQEMIELFELDGRHQGV
jgi:hypothetical protein